jgi:hypothetical protein
MALLFYELHCCTTNGTAALRTALLFCERHCCTTNGTAALRMALLQYELHCAAPYCTTHHYQWRCCTTNRNENNAALRIALGCTSLHTVLRIALGCTSQHYELRCSIANCTANYAALRMALPWERPLHSTALRRALFCIFSKYPLVACWLMIYCVCLVYWLFASPVALVPHTPCCCTVCELQCLRIVLRLGS